MDVKHILIAGIPGSGKTTYGEKLSKEKGLPLLSLDDIPTVGPTPFPGSREARKAVSELTTPHIVEGVQILGFTADELKNHDVIIMDAYAEELKSRLKERGYIDEDGVLHIGDEGEEGIDKAIKEFVPLTSRFYRRAPHAQLASSTKPMEKDSAKKEKEVQVWNQWMEQPNQQNLREVLQVLKPTIDANVNKLHGNLPKSAIRAQMTQLTVQYLPQYDPGKSKLNTYVENTAGQKLKRYVYEHQNLGSIPEPRIAKIGLYNRVRTNLEDSLGRPPTDQELADSMKWPVNQVQMLQKELRQDLIQQSEYVNVWGDERSDIDDILSMLHAELSGNEREVMEYLYGFNDKPLLSPSEIALKLNMSNSMITQIKNKLAKRLKESGALQGY